MIEILTTHIDTLIAFVTGGGLLTVLTIRATKKQAEAKAMRAVQEVYQDTIKDLREDKRLMSIEMDAMRISISTLRENLDNMIEEVRSLKRDRCTVRGCSQRTRK